MSLLREIMTRLSRRGDPPVAGNRGVSQAYGEQLSAAVDAALLYEWEWLAQALAGLPADATADRHQLLALRAELSREFQCRALSPVKAPAAVDPACHAWELTDPALRSAWQLG